MPEDKQETADAMIEAMRGFVIDTFKRPAALDVTDGRLETAANVAVTLLKFGH